MVTPTKSCCDALKQTARGATQVEVGSRGDLEIFKWKPFLFFPLSRREKTVSETHSLQLFRPTVSLRFFVACARPASAAAGLYLCVTLSRPQQQHQQKQQQQPHRSTRTAPQRQQRHHNRRPREVPLQMEQTRPGGEPDFELESDDDRSLVNAPNVQQEPVELEREGTWSRSRCANSSHSSSSRPER